MHGNKKSILVTGCNGQLGKEIQKLAVLFPTFNFLFASKETLPIEDLSAIKEYFKKTQIDFCVNCAAYTAVDKAETEKDMAFLINGTGAGNLSSVCKDHHTKFIHISTDYVFNGLSEIPYKEDFKIGPQNVYGASKLRGEELVLNNLPSSIIIRTSWVFSSFGNNFMKTMLRLMNERESINVVNDQFGSPTYAADLADVILNIIDNNNEIEGIFNYCNSGITTWFEFASFIKKYTKNNCQVHPITTFQFPTPAARPKYSSLNTSKIEQSLKIKIPSWQNASERCLSILSN